MAEGTITWRIKDKHITEVSITGISYKTDSGEVVSAPCSNIKSLFTSISHEIDAKDDSYSAVLRIEDGSVFRTRAYSSIDGNRLDDFCTFGQKQLFFGYSDPEKKSVRKIKPILHISIWDLNGDPDYGVLFPRYSYVMDSSIWNFFYRINPTGEQSEEDISHLKWIVETIANNSSNHVYETMNAREYADLNARMTYESYIANKENSGHGTFVSPFLFHSEWQMMKQRNEKRESLAEILSLSWRILLVDDKWSENLSMVRTDGESATECDYKINKFQIVKAQFESMGFSVINSNSQEVLEDNKPHLFIECVSTAEGALLKMREKKYDIILLDYLLETKMLGKPVEYGYEVLSKLNDDKQLRGNGLQGKNFFMFISAFTTAVNERLTREKLSRDEAWWLIGEGACPTNTPELFKFRIQHLMDRRLEQTGIKYLHETTILEIVRDIYMPSKTDSPELWIKSVRDRAYMRYHDVLGYHYDYCILREYDRGKSILVDSFLKDKVHMGAMLEHLLQLIHLTAFGTIRQWPEIWEEYKFFARTITNRDSLPDISDNIEKYIIVLKSA